MMTDFDDINDEQHQENLWRAEEFWRNVGEYYSHMATNNSRQRFLVAATTELRRRLPELTEDESYNVLVVENICFQFLVPRKDN